MSALSDANQIIKKSLHMTYHDKELPSNDFIILVERLNGLGLVVFFFYDTIFFFSEDLGGGP